MAVRLSALRAGRLFIPQENSWYSFLLQGLKGKGKVVPVLNLIKHYAIKAYGGVDV
jgi:hypothetical protein